MEHKDLPTDTINIILDFYGKIKYNKGKYTNIIHKHDARYNMLTPVIEKKIRILNTVQADNDGFYFEFSFNICRGVGLCFDCNYSHNNIFEICYYDIRNHGWKQIRTII